MRSHFVPLALTAPLLAFGLTAWALTGHSDAGNKEGAGPGVTTRTPQAGKVIENGTGKTLADARNGLDQRAATDAGKRCAAAAGQKLDSVSQTNEKSGQGKEFGYDPRGNYYEFTVYKVEREYAYKCK